MGKIIAFRGPYRGIGRTTSAMEIIGVGLAKKEKTIVALTQIPGRQQFLEDAFDENIPGSISREVYSKNGLWALWQRFRTERLNSDEVRESAVKTSMESLDIFPYMPCGSLTDDRTKLAITALILSDIKKAYDFVLVDVGEEVNDLTRAVISGSDAVVCTMPQSIRKWQNFLSMEDISLNAKNTLFLVNGSNDSADPTLKKIEMIFHKLLKGRKVFEIPFSTKVIASIDEGRMCEVLDDRFCRLSKNNASRLQLNVNRVIKEIMEVCEGDGIK